ncbi:MAG: hypothetical protein EXS09_15190 [Gemmataceae bacterium]|nr:hypothetical protein [Gemmataceae bacterium]
MRSRSMLMLAVLAFPVLADEPPQKGFQTDPRRDADLSGKLLKYDAAKGTVLIGSGGEGQKETTLLLDKAIQVLLDSKPGKLSDIPEGTSVRLFLNNDRSTAVFIQANGPTQRRVVTEVDATKRTLNFKREGGSGAIAVASDAVITIDGRDAKLEDLKPGTPAILWMTMDQKTVRFISVPKKRIVGGGENPRKEGDRKDGEKKEGDKK